MTTKSSKKQVETSKPARDEHGRLLPGHTANPNGRPPETEETKLVKKEVKKAIKEYEETLAGALEDISPALIGQAKKGNVPAIKEVHSVLGAHKRQSGPVAAVQINFADNDEFKK